MEHGIINDMAICIMTAWLLAVGAHLLRQPLILAYLVAGFAIGPHGMRWVADLHSVQTISELGLILLLFMIGLEIDLKKVLGAGRLITFTGGSQILGAFLLGLGLFWSFGSAAGIAGLSVIYLAAACALSSTVIVVKLLYDKRELDTLPGRITLGILVLQDIFAILFLAIQPKLGNPQIWPIVLALLKVSVLVAVAFTASRYALPPLFHTVARLPELVQVGALAWCFLIGSLGEVLGLSREMGALVAGVAISTFPYTLDVVAKVTSLRDFFLTLFFVSLGLGIPMPNVSLLLIAGGVCLFVVASRFITVFFPLHWMKQGLRAAILPGLNLCQISEFSLVILTLGVKSGHVPADIQAVVAYAFAIMAVGSTYAITWSEGIAGFLRNLLIKIGLRDLNHTASAPTRRHTPRIFMLGFFWTASSMLEDIARNEPEVLKDLRIIDFNPNVNHRLRERNVDIVYGDISQKDTLHHAEIEHAEIIVCSLPNTILKSITNLRLVQLLRQLNTRAKIICHAELISDVPKLYEAGADFVVLTRILEAQEFRNLLQAARNNLLQEKRTEQEQLLQDRNEVIA